MIASRAHDSVPAVVLNREITTAQWQTRRVTVFRSAKLARLLPVGTQVFLCKFTKRVVAVARARAACRRVSSVLKDTENYLKMYACTYLDAFLTRFLPRIRVSKSIVQSNSQQ